MAREDIDYDYEDFGMTAAELEAKYGMEGHPEFTRDNYNDNVASNGNTMSYWDWVVDGIKGDDESIPGNDAEGNPVSPDNPATAAPADLNVISDMDTFGSLVTDWHGKVMHDLDHLMTLTEGSQAEVYDAKTGTVTTVVIEGDAYRAFMAAVTTAKAIVGKLPFMAVVPEPSAPAAANDAEPS